MIARSGEAPAVAYTHAEILGSSFRQSQLVLLPYLTIVHGNKWKLSLSDFFRVLSPYLLHQKKSGRAVYFYKKGSALSLHDMQPRQMEVSTARPALHSLVKKTESWRGTSTSYPTISYNNEWTTFINKKCHAKNWGRNEPTGIIAKLLGHSKRFVFRVWLSSCWSCMVNKGSLPISTAAPSSTLLSPSWVNYRTCT